MEQAERVEMVRCSGVMIDGKPCRRWLGVRALGEVTMAHHGRVSSVRGELRVWCEHCGNLNVIETDA